MRHRPALAMLLLMLAALYAFWFARGSEWFAVAFFALPPLLLAVSALRGGRQAGYWSGVLALLWFSHGVMVAWSRPADRGVAWLAILLAVAIIIVANLPGLRARFGRNKTAE
ncbi:putative membrane protein [Luteimonas cucumeris]|uniref:Putative membrane protein n=1 Tax=Luteimonas cucumeris TaxID=985012 RepID=A0A562KZN1_9GAMM|nr:DUF2069 domain-containing protein [Luteimonas cucumeris]TWI00861.1 putative membrane protein [Luteimonas cucumeris]